MILDAGCWMLDGAQFPKSFSLMGAFPGSSIQYPVSGKKKPHRNAAFVKNLSIL